MKLSFLTNLSEMVSIIYMFTLFIKKKCVKVVRYFNGYKRYFLNLLFYRNPDNECDVTSI